MQDVVRGRIGGSVAGQQAQGSVWSVKGGVGISSQTRLKEWSRRDVIYVFCSSDLYGVGSLKGIPPRMRRMQGDEQLVTAAVRPAPHMQRFKG